MTQELINEILIINPEATIQDLKNYSTDSQLERDLLKVKDMNRDSRLRSEIFKSKLSDTTKSIWK